MANYIVLDTETTNSLDDPIAYDIGWAVVANDGSILKTESYAVAEIFLDRELMASAYFADKIPQYWDEIKNKDRKLDCLSTIWRTFKADYDAYEVNEIYAFNVRFDYLSTSLTSRFISCSKYRYFFPYDARVMDILKYARKVLKNDETYRKFCVDNGYTMKNGANRHTAEIVYRYWFDNKFNEAHKGIDDVLIENRILTKCKELMPDFDCEIFGE